MYISDEKGEGRGVKDEMNNDMPDICIKLFQIIMDPVVDSGEEKIVKTFKDTNYFAKGTYKRDFI